MALSDLIRPRSREQVVQRMLYTLGADPALGANFAPTNYVPGDPLRTLLELAGEGISDVDRLVAALAEAGYLDSAVGEWLSLLTESHYATTRQTSTFAQGLVRLVASPGSAVAAPAGLIVGTANGLKFSTLEAAVVPAGSYADVPVRAEQPGAAYNVPATTIRILHTPLPGLAVTNVGGWLLEAGADEEGDEALRRRARLRWSELGGGATRDAYEYWAFTAHPSVDRVRVLDEHPRGQGTVDVVLWGTGGLGDAAVTAVDAYVQARRPLTSDVQVYSAAERAVPVAVELYAPFGDRASIEAQVLSGLSALQRELPIGGTLYRAQVIEVAMLPPGVLDARTTFADVRPGAVEALTLVPRVSWRDTP
ncbi:baseplate J/gp47 family protein [Deinococcus wulumuqiensis]|uniref:Baseplate assembly protein n=1 Tax=Deinococcus wulumuqiensis TaxID=980427 RepID=A0AAV4K634_9DEIO|nr:baseplate J/gp47 family protein [Deinococcus wulumuqiensis]QII20060.1 baseplate J protein [Deinococcus wulumuqiensis R12]GGI87297.1 baseplate assembly protein [Deinococcus wulumuqiensis]GGP29996.1 baseplate assembly protein [Deinococcus wulumuqiensis]